MPASTRSTSACAFSNAAFATQNGLEFSLLSDYDRAVTRAYGVALDNFAGMPGYTASQRAVFIVSTETRIFLVRASSSVTRS